MTINKPTFWVEKLEAGGVKVEIVLFDGREIYLSLGKSSVNCLYLPIVFISF